jgi:hypothetical protein
VPDGVATVVITRRDGSSAQATVRNNFFDIPGPHAVGGDPPSPTAAASRGAPRWLDPAGNRVLPR